LDVKVCCHPPVLNGQTERIQPKESSGWNKSNIYQNLQNQSSAKVEHMKIDRSNPEISWLAGGLVLYHAVSNVFGNSSPMALFRIKHQWPEQRKDTEIMMIPEMSLMALVTSFRKRFWFGQTMASCNTHLSVKQNFHNIVFVPWIN
jgi:hypothetical protein